MFVDYGYICWRSDYVHLLTGDGNREYLTRIGKVASVVQLVLPV